LAGTISRSDWTPRTDPYLSYRSDYQQARELHERALNICQVRLGANHPDTAQNLHDLAFDLHDQGDFHAARTLLERALAIREARLRSDHPDTLQARQDLAAVVAELEDRR